MATETQTSKELVQRGFDALNERDREAFEDLHADDAVIEVFGEEIRGIDEIADTEFAYFEAFPDLELDVEDAVAEGDTVAVRWTITGTHEGEFDGIAPTGESVAYEAMGVFRLEDEQVAEVWLLADQLGLLQQLGVVEPPTG